MPPARHPCDQLPPTQGRQATLQWCAEAGQRLVTCLSWHSLPPVVPVSAPPPPWLPPQTPPGQLSLNLGGGCSCGCTPGIPGGGSAECHPDNFSSIHCVYTAPSWGGLVSTLGARWLLHGPPMPIFLTGLSSVISISCQQVFISIFTLPHGFSLLTGF